MSRPEEIDADELKSLEQALASLAPQKAKLDRDRLMFRSGELSAVKPSQFRSALPWAVAATFGLVAAVEAGWIATASRPLGAAPVVASNTGAESPLPKENSVPKSTPAGDANPRIVAATFDRPAYSVAEYSRNVDRLARLGLDALPQPASAAWLDHASSGTHQTSQYLLREEINTLLKTGETL